MRKQWKNTVRNWKLSTSMQRSQSWFAFIAVPPDKAYLFPRIRTHPDVSGPEFARLSSWQWKNKEEEATVIDRPRQPFIARVYPAQTTGWLLRPHLRKLTNELPSVVVEFVFPLSVVQKNNNQNQNQNIKSLN